MDPLIFSQAFDLALSAEVVAGVLMPVKLVLIKTNLALDRNTALADVVAAKADYTGAIEGVITWLAPSIADDGSIEVVGTVPEYRPTDAVTPNQIYGCALLTALDAALYAVCSFADGPLPMESALNSILATLRYKPEGGSMVVTIS